MDDDPIVIDTAGSRAATDALLDMLKRGRWSPPAITRFLALAAKRSVREALQRPRALTEITALHGALLMLGRGRGHGWVSASWTLSALHLGMLEDRDRLSLADILTLVRGNLPAIALGSSRWAGLIAIISISPTVALPAVKQPSVRSAITPTPWPTPHSGPGWYYDTNPTALYASQRSPRGCCRSPR